jgi:DsbC/DsbD-like thiol-disulfide interchange protein
MSRWLGLALGVVGCAHGRAASAATADEPAALAPEAVVQFKTPDAVRAVAGDAVDVAISLRIAAGYHVMSDRPSNALYIPTKLHFDSTGPFTWGDASYPPPRSFRLSDETITTFEGELTVHVPLHVASDAKPGTYLAQGTLGYQSCTVANCLFPVQRSVSVPVQVVP